MTELTKKQEAVRRFIADELSAGRPCPTHREVAARFGFASSYAAACHIKALITKNILIAESGKARALRFVDMTDDAPIAEIPLLGSIPAGFAEKKEQYVEDWVLLGIGTLGFKPTVNTFALRVMGDSMIGRHICQGDIAILEHGREPRSGEIVAALIDMENTLKTIVKKGDRWFLKSENRKYPDLIPYEYLTVQGVLRGLIRNMRE